MLLCFRLPPFREDSELGWVPLDWRDKCGALGCGLFTWVVRDSFSCVDNGWTNALHRPDIACFHIVNDLYSASNSHHVSSYHLQSVSQLSNPAAVKRLNLLAFTQTIVKASTRPPPPSIKSEIGHDGCLSPQIPVSRPEITPAFLPFASNWDSAQPSDPIVEAGR